MARPINQKLAKELRSMDIITYTFFSMFALLIGYVVFALFFGKPAKTKQVVQSTRVVKQVVYRAPKPLTPAEQKAEVENVFATIATDKINKNLKGIKFKTSITKDGWSEKVIDKKDNIQIKIGGVK